MVGFTPDHEGFDRPQDARTPSDRVAAVVNIAGVCDRRGGLGKGTANLLGPGFEKDVALRAFASPVVHVRAGCPPVYTLQGLEDRTVHPDSARRLDAALRAAGVPHVLELVPGAGHDPITLESMNSVADWLTRVLRDGRAAPVVRPAGGGDGPRDRASPDGARSRTGDDRPPR